jgi:hypothetical protein
VVGFALTVIAVIGTTMYLHRPPGWVGTAQPVTLSVSGQHIAPETIRAHGRWWDPPCPGNVSWSEASQHVGRLHFDSATKATFIGIDGTVLHFVGRTSGLTFGCEAIDAAN